MIAILLFTKPDSPNYARLALEEPSIYEVFTVVDKWQPVVLLYIASRDFCRNMTSYE